MGEAGCLRPHDPRQAGQLGTRDGDPLTRRASAILDTQSGVTYLVIEQTTGLRPKAAHPKLTSMQALLCSQTPAGSSHTQVGYRAMVVGWDLPCHHSPYIFPPPPLGAGPSWERLVPRRQVEVSSCLGPWPGPAGPEKPLLPYADLAAPKRKLLSTGRQVTGGAPAPQGWSLGAELVGVTLAASSHLDTPDAHLHRFGAGPEEVQLPQREPCPGGRRPPLSPRFPLCPREHPHSRAGSTSHGSRQSSGFSAGFPNPGRW